MATPSHTEIFKVIHCHGNGIYVIIRNLLETSATYRHVYTSIVNVWSVLCFCTVYCMFWSWAVPCLFQQSWTTSLWCTCSGGGNLPGPDNLQHFREWASGHGDFDTEWHLPWRHFGQCGSWWTARWVYIYTRELWACNMQTVVEGEVWVGVIGC